jgi:hypothetical protein
VSFLISEVTHPVEVDDSEKREVAKLAGWPVIPYGNQS